MSGSDQLYDVIIIGGGTTGLFAGYYASMRNLKVKIIEGHDDLGGKVRQFFPEKKLYDVGGMPGATGKEIVEQTIKQANMHAIEIITGQWVMKTEQLEDQSFALETSTGKVHHAKTILLATAMGAFNVVTDAISENKLVEFKQSIATNLMHMSHYQNKKIAISTNNRVGLDCALTLEKTAKSVYLINPADQFQHAKEEELQALESSDIHVYKSSEILDIKGDNNRLHKVVLGNEEEIEVDYMLVYHGVKLRAIDFEDWGLTSEKGRLQVGMDMSTNRKGIYAAGDAVIYEGKTMLIASGYTEAITAINSIAQYVDPKAPAQVYSTVIYRKR
ncbi:NAD(P)/FAD-dependent oxidoreductase [Saliterribacillus persicus]|uniref:Ferredoxin--NADP reductase n=1 Tax=Saliterribacillus persicus TaxID=930114 RepID=A0A368XYS5_9BACI|nr:NAD(P)/FAD-dependent oxidoreductase [Saliterribacillus persicus]RCW73132.1 thioredoxin reductase (NADPH) [Saliterribacillus persicus]